jgi:hypothetical protein
MIVAFRLPLVLSQDASEVHVYWDSPTGISKETCIVPVCVVAPKRPDKVIDGTQPRVRITPARKVTEICKR